MFKDKILMITGGTGSFGNAVLNHFLYTDIKEIRIFSRDEKKQEDMRIKYKNNKLNFIVGDIKDFDSVDSAMRDVDFVFHAAALKQVPSCEFYPIQAIKTNLLGAENVLEAAAKNNVKKVIVLSTDKAVYPINTMGMSKAIMEKLAISKARDARVQKNSGVICATRYGNVMASRGSAETRNLGILKASGEYITFLDDDDIYLPNKIRNQLQYMQKLDTDFSITDIWLYDEKDNLIEKRNRNYIKDDTSINLLKYHLMYHITGTDVMMFKKNYLLKIGMFPSIDIGDEFYLMMKAIEYKGKFCYLNVCDVKAYVHSQTDGMSSGEGKILGENNLYNFKKQYFTFLSKDERKYIKMRHYAVLAFAEYRQKRYFYVTKYLLYSFVSSPLNLFKLFIYRK
jgi:NADP-dependent 3-hydroxy acid dehydrogenase YdfG